MLSFFSRECCYLILQVLHITLLSFSDQIKSVQCYLLIVLLGLTPGWSETWEKGFSKGVRVLAQKLIK